MIPSSWARWSSSSWGRHPAGAVTYFGKWKYLWTEWFTSVDHKKIGIMYIIVALVMLLRRLRRRHHDAHVAGRRLGRLGRLPAAASLRPDLHRPRRHHDLLHGDAFHHGPDEHRRAAADRRARRGLPVPELAQLLADHGRRGAADAVAVRGRIRPRPAGWRIRRFRAGLQSGGRGRLLSLGLAAIGAGHHAERHQLHGHHHEDARALAWR